MHDDRILVAYDGTEEAFRALEQAADRALASGQELAVVTVMPRIVDAPREAIRYLFDRGLEATLHLPVGDPTTEIARIARQGDYRTIYVGRRREADRDDDFSVSSIVASSVPVSVLIAR